MLGEEEMSRENDAWDEIEELPQSVKIYRRRRDDLASRGLEPWRITLVELQGLGGWLAEQPLGLFQSITVYDDDILAMLAGNDPLTMWVSVSKHLSQSAGQCLAVGRLFDRLAMKLSNEIGDALRQAGVSDIDQ